MDTYYSLFDEGRIKLFKIQNGEEDARQLLLYALGIDMNELLLHYTDKEVDADKAENFRKLIDMRAAHIPLQHLTHSSHFYGLDLYVDENVLVPRFDTEVLVETVLNCEEHNPEPTKTALDMCTGSGCIAIALAKYGNFKKVYGADVSRAALEIADRNAEANGVEITFYESYMFEQMDEVTGLDVIVSNPPYIRTSVIDTLMPEVRDHDPRLALDGDEDGMYFYRIIAHEAPKHLAEGGRIYLEIGYDQAEEVSKLLADAGFRDIETVKDLAQLDRVVKARL